MANAYGEITWSYPRRRDSIAGLEVQYAGKMYVNDRNTDAAPAYTIGNLRIGFEQRIGAGCCASSRASTTSRTATTWERVIVGDTNGRYFEPAATRNFLVGLSVNASF